MVKMAEVILDTEYPTKLKDDIERVALLRDDIAIMYETSTDFEHYWQNRRKDLILKEMKRLIETENTKSFLDVGCAEGLFTREAANLGAKLVVGLDISKVKLQKALRYANGARAEHYVLGSAECLPFKDNAFSLTLLSRVLELVPNENQCLGEVQRVSRGFLIQSVPSIHPTPLKLRAVFKPEKVTFTYPDGIAQARFYNINELVEKLNKHWKINKTFGIAPITHFINLLNKNLWRWVQKLDDALENKLFFRFFGHDIFLLCSKLDSSQFVSSGQDQI
jgi:2-polyprenyl-3-methyl-5-hydroxy-6-metoxy-1,4-benzoquinol methylase